MTDLHLNFNDLASRKTGSSKYPVPFSLRLSREERARLYADAGGKALGAYIRECLFGDQVTRRKRRAASPVKDYEALGRVLGGLGRSRLSTNLNQLAKAVNMGALPVTPETEADLRQACRDIAIIRADLMRALGKSFRDGP